MTARMGPATTLADLTESQFSGQVADLARRLGYLRYHTYRSERSEPGWVDEAFVKDRLILAELKSEKGKPSAAQVRWLTALAHAGCEVHLLRPGDLHEFAVVLSHRLRFDRLGPCLVEQDGHRWQPCSLWLPSGCRVDDLPAVA